MKLKKITSLRTRHFLIVVLLFVVNFLSAFNSRDRKFIFNGEKKQNNNSVVFTENKGQFADQNSKPRPDILFGGSDGQIVFHISAGGISYQLYRVDSYRDVVDFKTKKVAKVINQQTVYRTDITWVNANKNPKAETDDVLQGYDNYYREQCPQGAVNVKSYTGIKLRNVYKNIDLHYYEKQGQLKHDYIVAPFADYKQIQLKIEGAKLNLLQDGSLLLETPLGKIQEQAPIVYQNGTQLNAKYQVNGNILSFEIENYNPAFDLMIDPVTRLWGTYYGGPGGEIGNACSTDSFGNVYMVGQTGSATSTLVATVGSHQSTFGGSNGDAFLVKFNSSGVRQWGTYYGGNGDESASSCATDASGNVFIAGSTVSNVGTAIATSGSHQSTYGTGSGDGFLAKFDGNGLRLWGTYYGGTGDDGARSCATDASGNVYLCGETNTGSGTIIATSGSHQPSNGGFRDGFLAKFDGNGVRQWGTYYGGSGLEMGTCCYIDATGNILMAGVTNSSTGTSIATGGSHQSGYAGGTSDGFLVKFNSAGVRQWGTYYGNTFTDFVYSCASDASGNIFICGETSGPAGTTIATPGSHQSTPGGVVDAFLVKFNSSGVRQWGTYYGVPGGTYGLCCAIDVSGNSYLTGHTASSSGTAIAGPGAHQSTHGGGTWDAFFVMFNTNGVRQWSTYYGGNGADYGRGCAIDATGNIFFCGQTTSGSGTVIATPGSHQSTPAITGIQAFLVKFKDCILPAQPSTITGSTSICPGATQNYSVVNDPIATSYIWNLPVGWTGTSSTNTIAATPGSSGIFTVTASNTCAASPQRTLLVTVNPIPTITVNNGTICIGDSFTLVGGGASTYSYSTGPLVSPNVTTSYSVTGTSSAGCVGSNTAISTVVVNPLPTVNISASSNLICQGDTVTLTATGAVSYTFYPGGSGTSITVSPSSLTNYSLAGTNSLNCVSTNSATTTVSVNPSPTISVFSNDTIICVGESATLTAQGGLSYTFNPGGVAANVVVSPASTSTYSVTGTGGNGCESTINFTQEVNECSAISEANVDYNLSNWFYPNPANDEIQINLKTNSEITVISEIGTVVCRLSLNEGTHFINLGHLSKGLYFINVNRSQNYKLILK